MATVPVAGIHVWDTHDTWWKIAERYTGNWMHWVLLVRANPQIRNPNLVPVGSRIRIPGDLLA